MAKNDIILLDAIIEEQKNILSPNEEIGKFFELFCSSELLKNFDLELKEIQDGITDGKDDGGIDSFYVIVNGHLLNDAKTFLFPNSNTVLDVYIITSKYHDTFKQEVLNNEVSTISELFDLSLSNEELKGDYNELLKKKRSEFIFAYKKTALKLSDINFYYYYVSRGDSNNVGENIHARANQLKQITQDFFGKSSVSYSFFGATELLECFRQKKQFDLDLPFMQSISTSDQTFIVLTRIKDYYKFLSDDKQSLRRYLFDSNVRSYMGYNKVNVDILNTLKNRDDLDFWWLNNGITILSSSAINMGKYIKISDVQIVNGLQTSETIYNYFSKQPIDKEDNRLVMIKIITASSSQVRDFIIQSTNNQTTVMEYSLHAMDKRQKDIEDILLRNGLYYERRANAYLNQGIDPNLIFAPLYLAAGYKTLIEKQILRGITLKQKFMRNQEEYDKVFSNDNLELWVNIAKIQRNIDCRLMEMWRKNQMKLSDGLLKSLRHVVSFFSVAILFKNYFYTSNQFKKLKIQKIDSFNYEEVINFIVSKQIENPANKDWKSKEFVLKLLKACSDKYSITNYDAFVKRFNPEKELRPFIPPTPKQPIIVTKETLTEVEKHTPKQPWDKGMSYKLAQELNIDYPIVKKAISILINKGVFKQQINGVLYNKDGSVYNP